MYAWFGEIAAAMGFAALFITHDIEEALMLSDTVYLLTGKPGRISARFEVRAPRPRRDDFSVSETFIHLKKDILTALNG
jgi:ABC-type nitrate/sulfonate/bicarbonate transport system ATPase subunit